MKSKTIKKVLRQKFDDFVGSITDEKVQALVRKNSIITGGSIASMLLREKVNDYDIYLKDVKTVLAVCAYYIKEFGPDAPKMNVIVRFADESYCVVSPDRIDSEGNINMEGLALRIDKPEIGLPTEEKKEASFEYEDIDRVMIRVKSQGVAKESDYECDDTPEEYQGNIAGIHEDNEMALENYLAASPAETNSTYLEECAENAEVDMPKPDSRPKYRPVFISSNAITLANKVQLIIRFFGDADEIHANYDFAHCTCYWESDDGKLTLPNEALECLLTKELRYRGSRYPLASIIRAKKFVLRGFTINAGQYLKMCMQLNELDLTKLSVLEDQLMGVDAFYFASMIAKIPEDKKIDGTIDSTYLITMIDRFF